MGHKIQPNSYRLGITKDWSSRWFVKKDLPQLLKEDLTIRKVIKEKIGSAGIDKIDIERNSSNCRIFIKASKPGLVIGRGGKGIEELTKAIETALSKLNKGKKDKKSTPISVNVEEIKRDDISASVIAQQIAWDLEKRMPFRRTMKKYLDLIMQNRSVQGSKIKLSGRLDGNEIARREWLSRGRLPLTTLRSDIDYGEATAFANYGAVGVKVWIFKGEKV
ncbi:MAG: 30S ribosomal protein S3 [Candidatus Harrisonbacteria bacterium]|nr:30S ribosomal protein S3 [Candidatus Harrisonbacteria bacterium]